MALSSEVPDSPLNGVGLGWCLQPGAGGAHLDSQSHRPLSVVLRLGVSLPQRPLGGQTCLERTASGSCTPPDSVSRRSPTQDLIRGDFKSPWSVPNSEQGKGKEGCPVIPAGL